MSELIFPPCKKCGKSHSMGVENRETGEITPMDICKDCLWMGTAHPVNCQITLEDLDENSNRWKIICSRKRMDI
jgi:hypothetical protein